LKSLELLGSMFLEALEDVKPKNLLREVVKFDGKAIEIGGDNFYLKDYRKIFVVGSGKASIEMAEALRDILGDAVESYLLISNSSRSIENFEVLKGDHPVPQEDSIQSTERLISHLSSFEKDDLYIYLLSGGTSSMVESPEEGILLEDLQKSYQTLLSHPLSIDEVNRVRKKLSKVKGGKLSQFSKAEGVVLALSDVFGSDMSVIGSAPLLFSEEMECAKETLQRRGIFNEFPESVKKVLDRDLPESIKELLYEKSPQPASPKHYLVGNNVTLLKKMSEIGEREGFYSEICGVDFRGEAREIAKLFVSIGRAKQKKIDKKTLLLFGGESSVTIKGKGVGGRNQELGLSALIELGDHSGVTILSSGTDGRDGSSSATGCIVNSEVFNFAKGMSINLHNYLQRNDSGTLFQLLGNAIVSGETGTNVMDVVAILIE
jgi:glycerate 2-kinase